ncbi:glycoside hydrolase family 16 protein [Tulasnella calospora MUT 4182]|uniref:Glycoside hydrolase family 16 protein n=1 Tax=Tulasnella calospora MUT 4182 TaxID=1051891 RepID=A0A0C3Q578_9AGAM|nr:glycoside hydrolase family 16 protein [Tulasnella calospora MUT 4182]
MKPQQLLPLVALLASPAFAAIRYYQVDETFVGDSFLDGFEHEDFADPTHGRVNYVDECAALEKSLTYVSKDTLDTVRVSSRKQYGYSMLVLDVRHMPTGCGTWPAFWTNSNNNTWPTGGEIDIIEGVNDEGPNASVLHTSSDHACTQTDSSMDDRGVLVSDKCTSAVGDGAGCRVNHDTDKSYGPELNAVGGGWYAMERTSQFVNVWFWARDDENVPDDVKDAATLKQSAKVNPDAWGQPQANFVSSNTCDLDAAIKPQNIIFNLSLCGDWAGNAYPSTCPSNCVDHVNNDPAAFKDAYWDIASLTILSPTSSGASRRHHHSHKRNYF